MLRRETLLRLHRYSNPSFLRLQKHGLRHRDRRKCTITPQQPNQSWLLHQGDLSPQGCYNAVIIRRCLSSWSVHSETGIVSYDKEPKFQTIIGLEIHAQLDIPTKLFSSAQCNSSRVPTTGSTTTTTLYHHHQTPPNTLIRPFDLAVPGMLPYCSKAAVQAAVLSAAALNCEIPKISRFERKHYHYADLPFGYQVTQQRWPIAKNGSIIPTVVPNKNKNKKKTKKTKGKQQVDDEGVVSIGIDRIQLEQDTGKTTTSTSVDSRDGSPIQMSNVDFNRAGCSLIEIVMNPDIRSSKQATATVETLRQLLKHIGTCNGRMEEGSLRVDLNVSIQPIPIILKDEDEDTTTTSTTIITSSSSSNNNNNTNNRVEVKNLNSLRQVQQAAEYEAIRQAKLLEQDETATFRETRTFHVKSGKTVLIRTKEGEEDYRFMPEPDLPPIVLNKEVLDGNTLEEFLDQNLAELPEAARERLRQDYELDEYTASVIAGDPPAIKLYDDAVETALLELGSSSSSSSSNNLPPQPDKQQQQQQQQHCKSVVAKAVAKILCNELFALIREDEERRRQVEGDIAVTTADVYSSVNGQQLGELVAIQEGGIISTTQGKKLLTILYREEQVIGRSPKDVAQERGLQLISDTKELRRLCLATIDQFPNQLDQYKKGGKHVIKMKKFFAGKVMAESKGNAHPERMHEALDEVLEEIAPGVTEI